MILISTIESKFGKGSLPQVRTHLQHSEKKRDEDEE